MEPAPARLVADTFTILDVTDKQNAALTHDLPERQLTHQGWLTEDSRYFLFNDVLDEQDHGVNTTTSILDATDLNEPVVRGTYVYGTPAITPLRQGQRGCTRRTTGSACGSWTPSRLKGTLRGVGYFDIYPADDKAQ